MFYRTVDFCRPLVTGIAGNSCCPNLVGVTVVAGACFHGPCVVAALKTC